LFLKIGDSFSDEPLQFAAQVVVRVPPVQRDFKPGPPLYAQPDGPSCCPAIQVFGIPGWLDDALLVHDHGDDFHVLLSDGCQDPANRLLCGVSRLHLARSQGGAEPFARPLQHPFQRARPGGDQDGDDQESLSWDEESDSAGFIEKGDAAFRPSASRFDYDLQGDPGLTCCNLQR